MPSRSITTMAPAAVSLAALPSAVSAVSPVPVQRTRIRVAMLGCGQIADAHLSQLQRIKFVDIVAVCDAYEDLAYQAAARFKIPTYFTNVQEMLRVTQPDVVHIATPAHTHAALAKQLLESGCHVYVEKPFTLNVQEADDVLRVASETGKQVCVGHDQLFDPMWLRARRMIGGGAVGEVRFVESILGYPIDGKFGALVKDDPQHWVRKLPGGLFQNTISHPLYRILDLLPDEQPLLLGNWLRREPYDFPTELQLGLEGAQVGGSLTFSTRIPPQRLTRVYGSKGMLAIDFDTQVIRREDRPRLPGAFAKLEAPLKQLGESCGNLARNMWRFAWGDIHYFAGMRTLFERFYRSILFAEATPIPAAEIRRVTAIMDQIFDHCRRQDGGQL